MGTGWMLVMVHMCEAWGQLWHGTALQFLPRCPESTNSSSTIPWVAGGGEKYTSTRYAPTQNHLLSSPWEDPQELSQVPFWLSEFFSWLERCWSACMSYQSPAEWVEMFSEHEICHASLKSTMDISKSQNLLERVFLMVKLSYSVWWAWTDIAKTMSHLSIVGRYVLLSHLQSHGEPICNVLLHGHLMCCGFGSVHLLICFFFFPLPFFFFGRPSYSPQIRAKTIQAGLNQSYEGESAILYVFRGLEICLLPSSQVTCFPKPVELLQFSPLLPICQLSR